MSGEFVDSSGQSYTPLTDTSGDYWSPSTDNSVTTSVVKPIDYTIGPDYSGSGGTNYNNGSNYATSSDTNFGFSPTEPPSSITDLVTKAAGSFDLSGIASKALDYLMDPTNWKTIAATAGSGSLKRLRWRMMN